MIQRFQQVGYIPYDTNDIPKEVETTSKTKKTKKQSDGVTTNLRGLGDLEAGMTSTRCQSNKKDHNKHTLTHIHTHTHTHTRVRHLNERQGILVRTHTHAHRDPARDYHLPTPLRTRTEQRTHTHSFLAAEHHHTQKGERDDIIIRNNPRSLTPSYASIASS